VSVSEETRTEALEQPEYCNVCENFPCLGNHPADVLAWIDNATFIWRGLVTRAELEQGVLGYDMVPTPWPDPPPYSPLRNWFRAGPSIAEQRAAEERDRREWTESVRRRLGLVAEVHRCRVWWCESCRWGWHCLRRGCDQLGDSQQSQADAFTKALAHARSFVPQPPEPEPFPELTWEDYKVLAVLAVVTTCQREPHPESPWHWADGTWWR
jgi:hypothetical protein